MELKSSSQLHSISTFDQTVELNNHLFSSIVTLYILIFLYFPSIFLNIVFSPVFVSTGVVLVCLLRLGAIQETKKELFPAEIVQTDYSRDQNKAEQVCTLHLTGSEEDKIYARDVMSARHVTGSEEGKIYAADVMSTTKNTESSNDETYTWDSCDFEFGNIDNSFVEWDVKAPLEIIYEDDEEEDDDDNNDESEKKYSSLSLYYPETETDCSSDDDYAMEMNWESAEMGEELIEIALDGKRMSQFLNDEEDSLIEIDISPGRNIEFAGQYY